MEELGRKRKLRPLQLWLLSKPKGMSRAERTAAFMRMSKEEVTPYAESTQHERGMA